MVKIAYKDLNDPRFIRGIQKLTSFKGGFSPKTSYNLAKMCEKIDKEIVTAAKLYQEIALKHAVLNEDGTIKKPEGGGIPFEFKEGHKEAFGKDFEEWQSIVVEIDRHPLKLSDMEDARITPEEVMALNGIIDPEE